MIAPANADEVVDRLLRDLRQQPRPLPLVGRLQPYAWGGDTYLRELTGLPLPAGSPAAEWWIGAHPSAPADVAIADGTSCRLDAVIARDPGVVLGARVAARHGGRLPFLLKVLDVRHMLSIQAHPTRAQAEAGFAREQAAGIPIDAAVRNYRDENPKPEALVALTPFHALAGFRAPDELDAIFAARPELRLLEADLHALRRERAAGDAGITRALYERTMVLPQQAVDGAVRPLLDRLTPAYHAGRLDRESPDFWVARAADTYAPAGGPCDRGLLAIYLMNLVTLLPGEGMYLGAGLLHAYLEGAAVEVMANSDNVLRGGLTPKHVDLAELSRVLDDGAGRPPLLDAVVSGQGERRFRIPAREFGLGRFDVSAGADVRLGPADGPEVLVVLEGAVVLRSAAGTLALPRGQAAFLPAGVACHLSADRQAVVFRAFVPA